MLGLFYSIYFILQYIAYPSLITDAKVFEQRGTIRINLPGVNFRHIAFFIAIQRFFTSYKMKYGLLALLIFTVAVLSGFRTVLATYLLLTTGFMLFNKNVKNKYLIFMLYAGVIVAGFFAFNAIITEMITSAEHEAAQGASNIRARAASFFLSLNEKHEFTYVLGNGEPSERSSYGRFLGRIALQRGYYLSDVGLIGFYFKFGLLASVAAVSLLFKGIFMRMRQEFIFIKLFFIFLLLLIVNTRTSFDYHDGIVSICMLLYLIDFDTQIRSDKSVDLA
jgi:hypothetical protein